MNIPDDAHHECRTLGMCALREHKGYSTCDQAGECVLALDQRRHPEAFDQFGPGRVWTMREFDAAQKP